MGKKNKRRKRPQEEASPQKAESGLSAPRRWLIGTALMLLLVVTAIYIGINNRPGDGEQPNGLLPFDELVTTVASTDFSDFVGSRSCMPCHKTIYEKWAESTHGKAGGLPGEVDIIAKFDGKPLRFKDATVYPLRKPGNRLIFRIEQPGLPAQEVEASGVVGGGHMVGGGTQSFFADFPDGSLRFLPFDFMRKEDHWFVQLRRNAHWVPITQDLSVRDLMHWPPFRILGTMAGRSNCQNCHGSQINVSDAGQGRVKTQFTTLAINCESCHGPGKQHVEWMQQPDAASREDIGMKALATLSKDQSLTLCFQCHAVKDEVRPGFLSGEPLEAHYSLKMPILGSDPFMTDGRVRAFAYQQNHLYSDCYINGSMTCVDCHDPHAQNYRDPFGKALAGRFDDGQCLTCHASKARAPEEHTHHLPGSQGSLCVSCHMPYLQHQGIGNTLGYARSDHTIPIPRPAFDTALGIENACYKCHQDRSIEWLQAKTDEWYGEIKPRHPAIRQLLAAEKINNRQLAAPKLLLAGLSHPIAQFSGLAQYVKRFLLPEMPLNESDTIDRLKTLAAHHDPDVQALALMALHLGYDHDKSIRQFIVRKVKAMDEKATAVQQRWAIAADYMGSYFAARGQLPAAAHAHRKALEVVSGDPVTMMNLAGVYQKQRQYTAALEILAEAAAADPQNGGPLMQRARIFIEQNRNDQAINELRKVLQREPGNIQARQMLLQLGGNQF